MHLEVQNTVTAGVSAPAPPEAVTGRDPLYLFGCHLEWRFSRNLKAYEELIAALDDTDENLCAVAEHFLRRSSPRPRRTFAPPQPVSSDYDRSESKFDT